MQVHTYIPNFTLYISGKAIPDLGAVEIMVLTAGQVVLIFFIIIAWFGMAGFVFCCELVHKRVKDRQHDPMDLDFGKTSISGKKAEEAVSLKKGVKTTTTTTSEDVVLQYPDISKWKKEFFEPKIDPGQPAIYNS